MYIAKKISTQNIKSLLNYMGGKQKILNQIRPLFPQNIHLWRDLFVLSMSDK
jgi:site-specific DNA-adenine methylase